MNYKFYLDYQLRLYALVVLSSITAYGVSLHFGYRPPILITPGHVTAWVSMSLSFIFIGTYIMAKEDPFNKG